MYFLREEGDQNLDFLAVLFVQVGELKFKLSKGGAVTQSTLRL